MSFYDKIRETAIQKSLEDCNQQIERFKLEIKRAAEKGEFKVAFYEKIRPATKAYFELEGFKVEIVRDPRAPQQKIVISWK